LTSYSLPIHGLIFLFQYNDADHSTEDAGEHVDDIWFANQVPEYACASIAILNIVNNIPGLDLGKELQEFKDFTKDMDPLMRGDTIDSFDFVKRIHNSFARENDMLNADMVTQGKVHKAKKAQALQKARDTREANKAAKASLQESSVNKTKPAVKTTSRLRRATARDSNASTKVSTPAGSRKATIASEPSDTEEDEEGEEGSDHGYNPKAATKSTEPAKTSTPPRRSGRARKQPKPRTVITDADYEEPDQGFHYVAYVPVGEHVWKLDGMDRYPQDVGTFKQGGNGADGGSGDWLHVVTPMIQSRMMQFGDDGKFSLMAVVRDPFFDEQKKLLENVKTLQAADLKLESLDPDWRDMEGGETRRDVITGISIEYEITQKDIDDAELPPSAEKFIANADDLLKLIEYRQGVLKEQTMRRSGVRDARQVPKEEEEDARLRKHDYGPFVRGWLSALAEDGLLQDLL
jgi:ubiquitin carboxyl-terminal hydrolase L5